jgi:hypothetical protein
MGSLGMDALRILEDHDIPILNIDMPMDPQEGKVGVRL